MDIEIDKNKTSLVVIDLQKGIVGLSCEPHSAEEVVVNASKIAEACREKGIPVFLVRVTPSADMKDSLHPLSEHQMNRGQFLPDWADIVPQLGPTEKDFVITKHQWGAFYGTELDLQLRRRGIDTIILCGISTNIGVESTARFAYEYGYNQIFVEDAMSALNEEEHENSVQGIFPRIGLVRKTEEILSALQ
ncbi:MAG: hydrolase [Patescibacteria group bacterium]|nr:hydrolase [Patescibacteria group bacterium]